MRTGDIAVADDDGYLYIVDRAKDLIIVSGFNVYPAEVEDVLLEHPGVAAVAVVGVTHPHTGESVKAFVRPGSNLSALEGYRRDRFKIAVGEGKPVPPVRVSASSTARPGTRSRKS